jgi:hypothetical protein
MTVAGDSRDRAIELARRMEDSRRFAQTNIISERFAGQQNNGGDTEQFDIAAIYIPETLTPVTAATPVPKAETKIPNKKPDTSARPDVRPKPIGPKGSKT